MCGDLPLSTLLSQTLVAYTFEFDNEFERRMPHRTSRGTKFIAHNALRAVRESGGGPWLVSMAMWLNCMQFVGEAGITVKDLEAGARTKTNLNGMIRWGYVTVGNDGLIRTTARGRQAQAVWRDVSGEMERRWEKRFPAMVSLRSVLTTLVEKIGLDLPDCLPILGYGLFSKVGVSKAPLGIATEDTPVLLSKVLLAFALDFEAESNLALAIVANLLRVLDDKGVRLAELPVRSGVSKEAIQMAMGIVRKKALVVLEKEENGRLRIIRLTPAGRKAQAEGNRLVTAVEDRWREWFGRDAIDNLRSLLSKMKPLLAAGLNPYPEGWRAGVRAAETLPYFPMVLHRGGFPDGS